MLKIKFQYVKDAITLYRLLCYYLSNSTAKIRLFSETTKYLCSQLGYTYVGLYFFNYLLIS